MHIVKVQSSMDIRDATGLGTLILIHGVILVINSCQISLTLSESLEELSHKRFPVFRGIHIHKQWVSHSFIQEIEFSIGMEQNAAVLVVDTAQRQHVQCTCVFLRLNAKVH